MNNSKTILVIFSSVISLIILLICGNFYLKITNPIVNSNLLWSLDTTDYSLRYIYWKKSFCKNHNEDCSSLLETVLTSKIKLIIPKKNMSIDHNNCTKILFLGDSFTDAPFFYDPQSQNKSYAEHFSQNFANEYSQCVYLYRLASGGTGSDQQYLKFFDNVKNIKPDIVVWQFYNNDYYENVKFALFKISKDTLVKRSTLTNTSFLTGYASQKLPYIFNTNLGRYLFYTLENKDVFRFWEIPLTDKQRLISYNKKKISLFLDQMDELSKTHSFDLYTTTAPLECNFIDRQNCNFDELNQIQNSLKNTLAENSHYISMDGISLGKNEHPILGHSDQNEKLFDQDDKLDKGQRHLSAKGQMMFGEILLKSYMSLFK
jgi:hypothetical protein